MKMNMAESALNRLLNFMDELDAGPAIPMPGVGGAEIDAALMQPTPEMPPAEGMDAALVKKGLGLEP